MYIHQTKDWPHFSWDKDIISTKLANVNKAAGFLARKLSAIGFDAQMNAAVVTLTYDILASSEIEGVVLNSGQGEGTLPGSSCGCSAGRDEKISGLVQCGFNTEGLC